MEQKSIITQTALLLVLISSLLPVILYGQKGIDSVHHVKKTVDFSIDGQGTATNWGKTEWLDIVPQNSKTQDGRLDTQAKVLYSETGIYFLFRCKDQVLTATMDADFESLWNEDVVEVFLWPDERSPVYFEYELSPLNYELILLISNREDNFASWRPFNYQGDRRTRHMTAVEDGEKQSRADISAWTAEFFIPFKLLHPLNNAKPEPGTKWRANLYRIDYDSGQTLLAWQPIEKSFHEYQRFGTFLFE
ncbi:carbohydrate-binding family 9-like protein [Aliifodinibius sp. S!AR15-10]|uniref:carbohydrate-binding family 9-like protein n=1 Tax=Aliifodinibius sp. S!AR15-10 TaxID=2950437 RepID=UPI002854C732|nr:carbohydrate-binding family 9-like protein [Aliifodinibius sp. S!AR15-10]MDR8392796.1 carbohydrate-binding family 9-like protein [Aliifodinibius sp. S!AR15-10]